ncbi:Tad domain-containing protein [Salinibacterium sp. NK8237]|uniref:Tad domain-containing protein n=1 Tax=Salinibacterium sp. NK8237 TaxID=2792038 RepID=UPI0018CEBCA8|nr:Tad domain-containing protein [Salinibacterium sp. NK8237]MBH0131630.1 Tad domain-containing protein [Salinibacterium sp. NK8237]
MSRRDGLRDDDGSALLLTIFYGFLSLVLIFLVVAATSLYLERKRLFTLADGAALVGAESYDLDDVLRTPQGFRPQLTPAKVSDAVREYVAAAPTSEFDGLTIEQATSIDNSSATVSLSAYWRPPFVSLLVPEGLRIDVTANARSVFS